MSRYVRTFRSADVVDLADGGGSPENSHQVDQGVVDGDRLGLRLDPPRRDHDWEPLDELAQDLQPMFSSPMTMPASKGGRRGPGPGGSTPPRRLRRCSESSSRSSPRPPRPPPAQYLAQRRRRRRLHRPGSSRRSPCQPGSGRDSRRPPDHPTPAADCPHRRCRHTPLAQRRCSRRDGVFSAVTSWPASVSALARTAPTNPVAPATATLIVRRCAQVRRTTSEHDAARYPNGSGATPTESREGSGRSTRLLPCSTHSFNPSGTPSDDDAQHVVTFG